MGSTHEAFHFTLLREFMKRDGSLHFTTSKMVLETDLCVGTTVDLSEINIIPEAGLYNGARGMIVNFVCTTVVGPNDKQSGHLLRCIIIDFAGLKLGNDKPWDKNNKMASHL